MLKDSGAFLFVDEKYIYIYITTFDLYTIVQKIFGCEINA